MLSGKSAELLAEQHLCAHGLQLIRKNFSCKLGEIDLIMQDPPYLVFVEVRFRKSTRFGTPLQTVTATKQRKIRATTQYFLQQVGNPDVAIRFDVVGISPSASERDYSIDWCKNAF